MKRPILRAINPDEKQSQDSGMNYKTVILITVLTTIVGQIGIDIYRSAKAKFKERREGPPPPYGQPPYGQSPYGQQALGPAPNPMQPMAPMGQNPMPGYPQPPTYQPMPMAMMEPEYQSRGPQLSPDELVEWQRQLERREETLENWQRNLQQDQRQLRLVSGSE